MEVTLQDTEGQLRKTRVVKWRSWTITAYRQLDQKYVAHATRPVKGGIAGFNVEDISEAGAIKKAQRLIKEKG